MDSSDYEKIFRKEAQQYQGLVSREDYEGSILPALQEICDFNGSTIVDTGAGTGRLMKLLVPLAQTKECSMGQFALAWLINQPGVTSPIVGPRTPEQLAENLGAAEITITDDDRAKVDAIIAPGTMVTPYYEADFGPHRHRL